MAFQFFAMINRLKRTRKLFAVKEWWNETSRAKRCCVKNCRSSPPFPLNQATRGLLSQALKPVVNDIVCVKTGGGIIFTRRTQQIRICLRKYGVGQWPRQRYL
jgi:hypothetical protein